VGLAVAHLVELGAPEQAVLLDARVGQAEGHLGAIERERDVGQQVAERPDVILMAVRQHAADDLVGPFVHPREVGQNNVDAEHVVVGKHEPAVEQQDLVLVLERRAVASDLSQAAQERDFQW
jgi:hypothetical protein